MTKKGTSGIQFYKECTTVVEGVSEINDFSVTSNEV
jgi:hypothetical protein